MKKVLTLGAAALLALGLVSCGQKDQDIEKTKINVWATAAEEAVIKALVDDYNATHENDFEYEFTPIAEGDCGTTLANDPTVKGAPALFLCADDHIPTLQSKNIVAEIKGARRENVVKSTSEVAVMGATLDDKLYGYPVTSDNGYFLWYDSSKLSSSDVASLETLLAKCKSLGKSFLMDCPNGWYANSFIMSPDACGTDSLHWLKDANGSVVYESNWDNEIGVKVSEYIAGLLTPYYADSTLKIGSNDVISACFKDGTMIAAVSGTWMENDLKAAIGDNLAAVKLPTYTIDGKQYQMASFTGSKIFCINKTRPVEEQKTAAALAELLTSKEGQLVRFEKRAALPCNLEAAKDSRYTENVSIGAKALLEQNAFACVQSKTAEARYWDIGKAIGQAYIDSQLGDAGTWKKFLEGQLNIIRNPQI